MQRRELLKLPDEVFFSSLAKHFSRNGFVSSEEKRGLAQKIYIFMLRIKASGNGLVVRR